MSKLAYLRDTLRFDLTKHVPGTITYRIGCSQCAAVSVNGHPMHETGCTHDTHECNGCNAVIPANQRYCGDCQ